MIQMMLRKTICEWEKEAKHNKIESIRKDDPASTFYHMGEEAAYRRIEKLLLKIQNEGIKYNLK